MENLPDSFIIKRSGLARVTAVARSNFDIVNGENEAGDFAFAFFVIPNPRDQAYRSLLFAR
jgi:hypothetical protein